MIKRAASPRLNRDLSQCASSDSLKDEENIHIGYMCHEQAKVKYDQHSSTSTYISHVSSDCLIEGSHIHTDSMESMAV